MNLKSIPSGILIFGDTKFRGQCPSEALEQVTFFARLRAQYPDYGKIAYHPRNEGKRFAAQVQRDKAEGMATGAADIIVPAGRSFVCELKRRDHTKSAIGDEQIAYLETVAKLGGFACIALGCDAARNAFSNYLAHKRI